MAQTKAKGTSKLGRDSAAQRLGVKKYAGESVNVGDIIIRQRGTKYRAGENTFLAKDDSIVAHSKGRVKFEHRKTALFTGRLKKQVYVTVQP